MKTPEDEAFDELATRQGDWGSGYQAKQQMAADKLQEPEREALKLALKSLEEIAENATTAYYDDWCGAEAEQALTAIKAALAQPAQEPTSGDYALGYAEGFNDACKKPAQEPVAFLDWYENAIWGNEDFQDGCHRAWDAALEHTPPQREWVGLTNDERKALERFTETCDDGEGYDVPKQMMQRLAQIGVVHHTSGGIYSTTEFGRWVIEAAPPKRERVVFPTMLRKMWSGGEVQAWLDENVNKEKNNGT